MLPPDETPTKESVVPETFAPGSSRMQGERGSRISKAEAFEIRVPLVRIFRTSNKETKSASAIVVRLESDSGIVGWGEGSCNPTFTQETASDARFASIALARQRLIGRSPAEAIAKLRDVPEDDCGAGIAALSAISMAVWDLAAREYRLPLYALLGGKRRNGVPVAQHLGAFDVEEDARTAKQAAEAGFSIVKLKVGRPDIDEDVAAVRRIRAVIGPETRLYVDANQAWTREAAGQFNVGARQAQVSVVEQPVAKGDIAGIAELHRMVDGTTVVADESIFDAEGLLSALRCQHTPGGVVVKVLKAAGLEGVVSLLDLCRVAGLPPLIAGMPGDTSIASAALLHIAVAAPDLQLGTAIAPHLAAGDVTARRLTVERGELRLSQLGAYGLGIDVDEDRLRRLT